MEKEKLHLTGRPIRRVYLFLHNKTYKTGKRNRGDSSCGGDCNTVRLEQKREDNRNRALWFGRKFFTNSGIEFNYFCR